jgi:RNA polymerase sigma-70 factor (ECF subfamily)
MTDGEESLVIRSRDNADREAFEQLVRQTARSLFAKLFLQIGDAHRAEDLVQETYLRAWQNLSKLSDAKNFRAWLSAIAQAVLVDATRWDSRKKRKGTATKDELKISEAIDPAASPTDSIDRQEQHERLLTILRNLPSEYRDVLTLHYLGGADYQTISRQLGISNGSLRGLLNRGMKLLREQIARPS